MTFFFIFIKRKKKMFGDSNFKLTWDASIDQFREDLPWAMIAFTIMIGAVIAIVLIIYLGDCCLGGAFKSRYTRDHDRYTKKTRRCGRSMGRLFILFFAAFIGISGFWIAANAYGVSFWNILFSYGIVALMISTMFGFALSCLGAYILISWTNKFTEDRYIIFDLLPIEGRVLTINILWTTLERIGVKQNGRKYIRYHFTPTILFINSSFSTDDDKEQELESLKDSISDGGNVSVPIVTSSTSLNVNGRSNGVRVRVH